MHFCVPSFICVLCASPAVSNKTWFRHNTRSCLPPPSFFFAVQFGMGPINWRQCSGAPPWCICVDKSLVPLGARSVTWTLAVQRTQNNFVFKVFPDKEEEVQHDISAPSELNRWVWNDYICVIFFWHKLYVETEMELKKMYIWSVFYLLSRSVAEFTIFNFVVNTNDSRFYYVLTLIQHSHITLLISAQ